MATVALQGAPVTNNSGQTEVASVTFSATVATGTNTCMAVCVENESDGAGGCNVTSITFNGASLTFLDRSDNATWSGSEIWYKVAPAVTTANVVVNMSPNDKWITGVYIADEVDQTTPLRTAAKSTGTGTSVSNTVSGVVADDLVFDSLCIDGGTHAVAPGADETERWEIDVFSSSYCTGISDTQPGSAGGVMSHTWTGSSPYSHVATAFIAAGGAAEPPPPLSRQYYQAVRRAAVY